MIRFVYFDAGGTLIAPSPSVGAVYAAAGRPHGLKVSDAGMDAAFRAEWPAHAASLGIRVLSRGLDDESTRGWWRALVYQVLERVGFEGDQEACFLACYEAFALPSAWRIFEDTLPALEALAAKGLPMGVLSNWDYRLAPLLDALDLSRWFGPVLISALEGVEKPDPEIFLRAAQRVGLTPAEIAYVGDHPSLDLDPALALGMQAFLIDRAGRSDSPHAIRRLDELPSRLNRP